MKKAEVDIGTDSIDILSIILSNKIKSWSLPETRKHKKELLRRVFT